jgi:nitroimidazol reductase NimA-like FMN-containing flavoprotein (pyridoxamine 5'-phosphate oxidase superfamily)
VTAATAPRGPADPEPAGLSVDACWAHLRSVDLGRLAVLAGGRPEIFPVNFVVDDATIVFRTSEGTKLAAATIWPDVAFEADGHDPSTGTAWSVVVKGTAQEITRLDELVAADALPLHPEQSGPKLRVLRIMPTEVTGRQFATAPPASPRSAGQVP